MAGRMVQCPLNRAHIMKEDSLQIHLINCSKKYPDHVTCPYNALHKFLSEDKLLEHVKVCPNMDILERWIYQSSENERLRQAPYHVPNIKDFNLEHENWSNDVEVSVES